MIMRLAVATAMAVCACSVWGQAPPNAAETTSSAFPHPIVLLLRDGSVQEELRLKDVQKKAIAAIVAKVDEPLWLLRDAPPQAAWEKTRPLLEHVESAAQRVFDANQRRRFEQILLQALGSAALGRPAVMRELNLTVDQRQQLQTIDEATQRELRDLQDKVNGGKETAGAAKAAAIQAQQQQRKAALLTDAQKQHWATLGGKPFDFARLRQVAVAAPELRAVDAWVNTAPLSLAGLRGRVVALHFWTFG